MTVISNLAGALPRPDQFAFDQPTPPAARSSPRRPLVARLSIIGADDADVSVFQQPWWLEAVTGQTVESVTAGDGHNTFLWMPYAERWWCGKRILAMPPLTHTLGPVVRLPDAKAISRSRLRRKLIETALAGLPPHGGFGQVLGPEAGPALDYALNGYEVTLRHSYRVATTGGTEAVWAGMNDKARNVIRRATRLLDLEDGMSVLDFHALYDRNLRRRGLRNQHPRALYERLAAALERRGRHRIVVARQRAGGGIAAAVMLVWDRTALYYLRATHDREAAFTGAASLLVWEAIRHAAELGLVFDSDSFAGRGGAMFIEAFGATPVARPTVTRFGPVLKVVQAAQRLPGLRDVLPVWL